MPLIFLIIYIVLCYILYKKNKENIYFIPLVVKLSWVIAFLLLFIFIIYYSEIKTISVKLYTQSFYFLLFLYIIIFTFYLFKYRNILIKKKLILYSNKWNTERLIIKLYLFVLCFLSSVYFFYSDKLNLTWGDWLQILFYIFFILSSLYLSFEKNILCIKDMQ